MRQGVGEAKTVCADDAENCQTMRAHAECAVLGRARHRKQTARFVLVDREFGDGCCVDRFPGQHKHEHEDCDCDWDWDCRI
jgi:hypothetical protein